MSENNLTKFQKLAALHFGQDVVFEEKTANNEEVVLVSSRDERSNTYRYFLTVQQHSNDVGNTVEITDRLAFEFLEAGTVTNSIVLEGDNNE